MDLSNLNQCETGVCDRNRCPEMLIFTVKFLFHLQNEVCFQNIY